MGKIQCIDKIAVFAGKGLLPRQVFDSCVIKGIECHIIGLENQTSSELFTDINYETFPLHLVGKIINKLKKLGVSYIVLAGKVKRTSISKLLLDAKGAKLFAMLVRGGLGDNSILGTIIRFFENEGFTIIPPEQIATEIIVKKGNLTPEVSIDESAKEDMYKGVKVLKGIAQFDVGQALVIQGGLVLGVEAAEGTDELIKRCGEIQQKGEESPILIKVCKPYQDKRIDLPCIGPNTIANLHRYGLRGIALEAEFSLILNQVETIKAASKSGIFIYGI